MGVARTCCAQVALHVGADEAIDGQCQRMIRLRIECTRNNRMSFLCLASCITAPALRHTQYMPFAEPGTRRGKARMTFDEVRQHCM